MGASRQEKKELDGMMNDRWFFSSSSSFPAAKHD
jgi:hypothetical protein